MFSKVVNFAGLGWVREGKGLGPWVPGVGGIGSHRPTALGQIWPETAQNIGSHRPTFRGALGGLFTGHDPDYADQAVRNTCEWYPDIREKITDAN